jgi:dynactin complex subunit
MSASNDIDVELLQDEINDAAAEMQRLRAQNAELERALEAERGEVSRLTQLLEKAEVTP